MTNLEKIEMHNSKLKDNLREGKDILDIIQTLPAPGSSSNIHIYKTLEEAIDARYSFDFKPGEYCIIYDPDIPVEKPLDLYDEFTELYLAPIIFAPELIITTSSVFIIENQEMLRLQCYVRADVVEITGMLDPQNYTNIRIVYQKNGPHWEKTMSRDNITGAIVPDLIVSDTLMHVTKRDQWDDPKAIGTFFKILIDGSSGFYKLEESGDLTKIPVI